MTSDSSSDSEHEERLATLLADLTDRALRNEEVDIHAVCQENPELADELLELWGTVLVTEVAGSNASEVTQDTDAQGERAQFTLELPCSLGDYELLEELGRGGMGVVYRAKQVSLQREVAVKMLLRDIQASGSELERFQVEAESAARLDHPNVVPVYEVGRLEGRAFFSMKLIRGQTLAEKLADGPLGPREAADILHQVACGVQAAHENGLLHRDLKPSNILIDENGVAHVTDFGLVKRVSEAESLTRTGAVLGTPAYMAPEQAAGDRGVSGPASDVYSLGSILYHMLTGFPPFQAANPVDTVLMVLEQDPVPPRLVNRKADRDLEMIALRCLQKPSDLRYVSAGALAEDLDAYLKDEPITARTGRFLQVLSRLFRETHHATVLENWGVLWMWHSLVLFIACLLTNAMHWSGFHDRWYYVMLWTAGFGAWAMVFWRLRHRVGPITFVERQIAHVWGASMAGIGLLFLVEYQLGLPVLQLSPVLGLVTGMVFFIKAGILSGQFYFQAFALFGAAVLMARFPDYAHLIFGTISAACFFFPGLQYYLQRRRATLS